MANPVQAPSGLVFGNMLANGAVVLSPIASIAFKRFPVFAIGSIAVVALGNFAWNVLSTSGNAVGNVAQRAFD